MLCINFVSELTSLPTVVVFLSFFVMDRVTRHILSMRLLVACQPVLLEPFKVISGVMQCDKMRHGLCGGSSTASLNIIFFCSADFFSFGCTLLTWGVDWLSVSLLFICIISAPATFANKQIVGWLIWELWFLNKLILPRKVLRYSLTIFHIMQKLRLLWSILTF